MMRIILITIVFLCSPSNSYAISAEKHAEVTGKAIEYYNKCLIEYGLSDHLSEGGSIIKRYSKQEDKDIFRWMNWHFYDHFNNSDDEMGTYWGLIIPMDKSLHYILNERIKSLLYTIKSNKSKEKTFENSRDIFEYTGRIIHYIQDMSVPAHVAPIFHISDFFIFKIIGAGADYFDSMAWWDSGIVSKEAQLCPTIEYINSLNAKIDKDYNNIDFIAGEIINDILVDAAENTRNQLNEKIPGDDKSWGEKYWNIRDGDPKKDEEFQQKSAMKGFATYGIKGKDGFKSLCQSNKETDWRLCMEFFKGRYENAIKSSIKLLFAANKLITN